MTRIYTRTSYRCTEMLRALAQAEALRAVGKEAEADKATGLARQYAHDVVRILLQPERKVRVKTA